MDLLSSTLIATAGAALGVFIKALIDRRRIQAEVDQIAAATRKTESETRQTAEVFLWGSVDKLTDRMVLLEEELKTARDAYAAEMKQAAATQATAQVEYEKQVNELHRKIGDLAQQLDRANAQLEVANATISGLQEIVTGLRQQVTDLFDKLTESERK